MNTVLPAGDGGPQQQGAGRSDRLGQAFCILVSAAWSTPRSGKIRSRSCRGAPVAGWLNHHHFIRGCNALSYLTARPAQARSTRSAPAAQPQLAALCSSNYAEFWQFFGEAASPSNIGLYRERLRPAGLDRYAHGWISATSSDVRGMPISRMTPSSRMLGRFIGLAHKMAKLARSCRAAERQTGADPGSPSAGSPAPAFPFAAGAFDHRVRNPALLFT